MELCDAMRSAGITDPESQDGIEFCIFHCPYPYCVLFEKESKKDMAQRKEDVARILRAHKVSVGDIAMILGVKKETVRRYLR